MRTLCCLLLLTLVSFVGVRAQGQDVKKEGDKETKKEADKLEGTWKVVEAERNGVKAPEAEAGKLKVVFKSDKLIIQSGDKGAKEATFTLEPDKKPSAIDLVPQDGKDKGKTLPGIYALKGDDLKLCFRDSGKDRPTEFATKPDSSLVLFVLKRGK